jgi:Protein of unknown function (DUF2723)
VASRVTVSCIVATLAFWTYTQTLLPGVDPGDTGGFQAAVLWPQVSARQAYPLYYNLARPFVLATAPMDPARALNLFSAIWAAAAVGLLVFVCATVSRSLAGGAVAGGLLAFSYTFWTQAIIAEVYTLHLALIALCLVLLYTYAARPTLARLTTFFVVYAITFGNHISMILLIVPFAVFLLQSAPAPASLFRPAVVSIALAAVLASALQYAPNFLSVASAFDAPAGWSNRAAAFWFDTTKQDWRDTMVFGIQANQATDRLAMWWFDARQQFGVAGLALAVAGIVGLWRISRRWAVLVVSTLAINTAFALTYNVGDTHVFFLPGHLVTAFLAGAAVAWIAGWLAMAKAPRVLVVLVAVLYIGWRGWSTWPAVDRHADRRAEQLIARLSFGINERDAVLVSEMNWQLENVLLYVQRHLRPDLAWIRLGDVMAQWPFLVEDNQSIGRDLILTPQAAADVVAAYGPAYAVVPDAALPVRTLEQAADAVPRGMPYVLSVLTPPREEHLDPEALGVAVRALTGAEASLASDSAFEVIAGVAGERAQVHRESNKPFTVRFQILEESITVRMDSWLPSDTFRRAGFGHVLRGREHVMIIERGVNLVWFGRDGSTSQPFYWASLYAAQPRFRLPAATLQLAHLGLLRPGREPGSPVVLGSKLEGVGGSDDISPRARPARVVPHAGTDRRSVPTGARRTGTLATAAVSGDSRLRRRLRPHLPRRRAAHPDH